MSDARLYAVVLVVSLAQFVTGMFSGWPSPTVPNLLDRDPSSEVAADEASWTVSLLKLGTSFGCFLSIFMVDFMGRKLAILLAIVPSLAGWFLMEWGTSIPSLYVARFTGGVASGIIFTCGSIYVTEVSPPTIRGSLCSYFVIISYCGSLLGYVVGPLDTVKQYSYAAMTVVVLQFMMFILFPETPYYLLRQKRYSAAMDSLMFFRGSADVTEEIDSIMRSLEAVPSKPGFFSCVLHLLSQSGGKEIILMGVGVTTIQAFSGSVVLILYAQRIFQKIHDLQVHETYTSVVLATVHVISYLLCICQVDRSGRRPLLIASAIGVATCSFLLGVYFCMQDNDLDVTNLQWLAFAAILFYVASISVGLTSVPFVVINEIFPMYAKATCASLCFALNSLWSFVMVRVWNTVAVEHTMYAAFWFISGLNVFSVLFLVFYLPETKREPLARIQQKLAHRTKN